MEYWEVPVLSVHFIILLVKFSTVLLPILVGVRFIVSVSLQDNHLPLFSNSLLYFKKPVNIFTIKVHQTRFHI